MVFKINGQPRRLSISATLSFNSYCEENSGKYNVFILMLLMFYPYEEISSDEQVSAHNLPIE